MATQECRCSLTTVLPGRFCDGHRGGFRSAFRFEHFQDDHDVVTDIIHNPANPAFHISRCILQYWDASFSFGEGLTVHLAITHPGGSEEALGDILLVGGEHMDRCQTAL